MTKIAILVSGSGTNMEALCDHIQRKDLDAEVAFVASDNPEAPALVKADRLGIRTVVLPYRKAGRNDAEKVLTDLLDQADVEWVVLAGFMKILSTEFVAGHKDRIVNIHPSLLPAFPGAKGIEDAWNYGVKITGVTIHLVDEKMDNGPVLAQEAVKVETKDTLERLAEKIHKTEHDLYWKTLSSLFKGKLIYTNRRNS